MKMATQWWQSPKFHSVVVNNGTGDKYLRPLCKGGSANPPPATPRDATCTDKGGSESLRRDITEC